MQNYKLHKKKIKSTPNDSDNSLYKEIDKVHTMQSSCDHERNPKKRKVNSSPDHRTTEPIDNSDIGKDKHYIKIPSNEIQISSELLGKGKFASVYKGSLNIYRLIGEVLK